MKDKPWVLTGSADLSIRMWDRYSGACLTTNAVHKGPVRGLVVLPRLYLASASNDGTMLISIINQESAQIQKVAEIRDVHLGHFIYTLSGKKEGNDYLMASGGEDRRLVLTRILNSGVDEFAQEILHPGTIWSVMYLPDGDIATACSDGTIRLFSTQRERLSSEQEKSEFESLASSQNISQDKVDVSKFENAAIALQEPGSKDGEQRVVRRGDSAEVHRWSASSSMWEKVGDVVGNPAMTPKGNVSYDWTFDVDAGNGREMKKLGYNRGEDPYIAAQRFIDENQLSPEFLDQISEFLIQQVGEHMPRALSSGDTLTGASRYVPRTTNIPANSSEVHGLGPAPIRDQNLPHVPWKGGFISFSHSDQSSRIMGKITQLNQDSPSLSEAELSDFEKKILPVLSQGQGQLSAHQHEILACLLFKPTQLSFPLIDIGTLLFHSVVPCRSDIFFFPVARLYVARQDGSCALLDYDNGVIIQRVIGEFKRSDASLATVILGLRFLCNLFVTPRAREAARNVFDPVVHLLDRDLPHMGDKRVRQCCSSLVVNYSVLFASGVILDSEGKQLLGVCQRGVQSGDELSVYMYLAAVGTLLVSHPRLSQTALESGLVEGLTSLGATSTRISECVRDIEQLLQ
uniref:Phospholipase A-2-activating protein n=1 Tax=Compsopogon caeruleus TaxID=31354 RepID=A0A7S1XE35_9RHOD